MSAMDIDHSLDADGTQEVDECLKEDNRHSNEENGGAEEDGSVTEDDVDIKAKEDDGGASDEENGWANEDDGDANKADAGANEENGRANEDDGDANKADAGANEENAGPKENDRDASKAEAGANEENGGAKEDDGGVNKADAAVNEENGCAKEDNGGVKVDNRVTLGKRKTDVNLSKSDQRADQLGEVHFEIAACQQVVNQLLCEKKKINAEVNANFRRKREMQTSNAENRLFRKNYTKNDGILRAKVVEAQKNGNDSALEKAKIEYREFLKKGSVLDITAGYQNPKTTWEYERDIDKGLEELRVIEAKHKEKMRQLFLLQQKADRLSKILRLEVMWEEKREIKKKKKTLESEIWGDDISEEDLSLMDLSVSEGQLVEVGQSNSGPENEGQGVDQVDQEKKKKSLQSEIWGDDISEEELSLMQNEGQGVDRADQMMTAEEMMEVLEN